MTFDRFDICEAHYLLERDYNRNGWLPERPSNRRRMEATHVQLARMGFRPSPGLNDVCDLEENGQEIYYHLERRYGFAPTLKGCPFAREAERHARAIDRALK